MGVFSTLFSKKIGGYIKAYGLESWWNNSFTKEEQEYIMSKYQPMGGSKNMLTEGDLETTKDSKSMFLASLSMWFNTKKDLDIARKMINESEKVYSKMSYMDQHYYYLLLIKHYYLDRDDAKSFEHAIDACENQISISKKAKLALKNELGTLPSHTGFKQLAIIEEKRGNYKRAIDLSKQALEEGWNGDWEIRINRLNKKTTNKA